MLVQNVVLVTLSVAFSFQFAQAKSDSKAIQNYCEQNPATLEYQSLKEQVDSTKDGLDELNRRITTKGVDGLSDEDLVPLAKTGKILTVLWGASTLIARHDYSQSFDAETAKNLKIFANLNSGAYGVTLWSIQYVGAAMSENFDSRMTQIKNEALEDMKKSAELLKKAGQQAKKSDVQKIRATAPLFDKLMAVQVCVVQHKLSQQ